MILNHIYTKEDKEKVKHMRKTTHYRHGGEETPQYFCIRCMKTHTKHSKKGKEHWEYRQ